MNFKSKEGYFDYLRRRWSHTTYKPAACMTYFFSLDPLEEPEDRVMEKVDEGGRETLDRLLSIKPPILNPGMTVFEIGFGVGRTAFPISEYLTAGRYVGFDISPTYVEMARRRTAPKNCTFAVTNGYEFPEGYTGADLIMSFAVFCHMPTHMVWRWLLECKRVLAPSGLVCLQLYNMAGRKWDEFTGQSDSWQFVTDCGHSRSVTEDTVRLLFGRAGFTIREMVPLDIEKGEPYSWLTIAGVKP